MLSSRPIPTSPREDALQVIQSAFDTLTDCDADAHDRALAAADAVRAALRLRDASDDFTVRIRSGEIEITPTVGGRWDACTVTPRAAALAAMMIVNGDAEAGELVAVAEGA